jgi:hypothetical protein
LNERHCGETRTYSAHDCGCGDEKPAPSLVHAISWHLFLQLEENPAGSVSLELSIVGAQSLETHFPVIQQYSGPSPLLNAHFIRFTPC